jgi:hypothetical protein
MRFERRGAKPVLFPILAYVLFPILAYMGSPVRFKPGPASIACGRSGLMVGLHVIYRPTVMACGRHRPFSLDPGDPVS